MKARRLKRLGVWLSTWTVVLSCMLLLGLAKSPVQASLCKAPWPNRVIQDRNEFDFRRQNGVWHLSYKSPGKIPDIACDIDDNLHQQLKAEFGLFFCEDQERKPRDLRNIAACKCQKDKDIVPLTLRDSEYVGYLRKRFMMQIKFVRDQRRPVDCTGQAPLVIPDYPSLATKAAGALENCAKDLEKKFGSEGGLAGNTEAERAWLAFFQAMRNPTTQDDQQELDPEIDGNKWVATLRVPTDVMIQNRGDCDSKALAFLALQRNQNDQRFLFFSTQLECDSTCEFQHAFVAMLPAPSSATEMKFDPKKVLEEVRINDSTFDHDDRDEVKLSLTIGVILKFDVLDLPGPGITKPGELDPRKYGWYIGLPIERGNVLHGQQPVTKRIG